MTPRRLALAAALIFLAGVYLLANHRDLDRGPSLDEVEHLHTAVRMARGERIFVDFAQHHSPLFHALLLPLAPQEQTLEAMQRYVSRARLLAYATAAATLGVAAFVVWRTAGNAWAAVIFVGFALGASGLWRSGLGDIRPETPALALWWTGAALVLLSRRPPLRGLGAGLVGLSALMAPKWPLPTLVIGVVFAIRLWRDRRSVLSAIVAALLPPLAGLAGIALLSDLRLTYFHVVELSARMIDVFRATDHTLWMAMEHCPPLVRPETVALAGLLVGAAWFRVRAVFAMPGVVAILFAVAGAALAELCIFLPYRLIAIRHFAFWAIVACALLALVPQSAAALIPIPSWRPAIVALAVLIALVASLDLIDPPPSRPDYYWRSSAWLMARLGQDETVWVGTKRQPLGVATASYYWYGMSDIIPAALPASRTERGRRFLPQMAEQDLPPCRLERRLEPHLRFLARPPEALPIARACFDRAMQRGLVVPTPVAEVYEVRRG